MQFRSKTCTTILYAFPYRQRLYMSVLSVCESETPQALTARRTWALLRSFLFPSPGHGVPLRKRNNDIPDSLALGTAIAET
jgi:hypothetical protein